MDEGLLQSLRLVGTGLGIGLLIGVERERKGDSRGLRTFGLVALLGTLTALLSQRLAMPALVPVGLALIGRGARTRAAQRPTTDTPWPARASASVSPTCHPWSTSGQTTKISPSSVSKVSSRKLPR